MSTNSIRVAIRVTILTSLLFTLVVVALPSQASSGYTCDMCSPMARWCRYEYEESLTVRYLKGHGFNRAQIAHIRKQQPKERSD